MRNFSFSEWNALPEAQISRLREDLFSFAQQTLPTFVLNEVVHVLAVMFKRRQLNQAMLLTPSGASARPLLTVVLLLAAGLYQFSPLKRTCLGRCRMPVPGTDLRGAFRAGVAYGVQCVGCCWLLMLLLFAAGVMTLWWVVALSVVVFVERVGPWRRWAERLIGAGCLAAAGWIALAR